MQKTLATILFLALPFALYAQTAPEILQSTDEAMLIGVLEKEGTDNDTLFLKNLAVKRLGTHGTQACVPVLAKLLDDEKMAHYARYALETIPDPAVDAALRDATQRDGDKALKGAYLAGVLNSIGVRRDREAFSAVVPFVNDADAEVAKSALGCLGYIGTPETADALLAADVAAPLKKTQADAMFECAQHLVRAAGYEKAIELYTAVQNGDFPAYQKNGAIYWQIKTLGEIAPEKATDLLLEQLRGEDFGRFEVGLKAGRELPSGEAVTKVMIGELDKLTGDRKALLLCAIGDRTDAASQKLVAPVLDAMIAPKGTDENEAVRLAAIETAAKSDKTARGRIADLLALANGKTGSLVTEAAMRALTNLAGSEVDQVVTEMLPDQTQPSMKIVMLRLIEKRQVRSAFDAVQKCLADPDGGVRGAATAACGQIATIDALPMLLDKLYAAQTGGEIGTMKSVLFSACTRMPKDAAAETVSTSFDRCPAPHKPILIELLKEIGGKTAVAFVEGCAWGSDEALKDKATDVLGSWRSPEDNDLVAAACLKLAKEAAENKYRIRGLRGYIRLPRQYTSIPEDRKLEMTAEFLALAKRQEDKLLALDVYARTPTPKMLAAALACLDDADMKDKAVETVIVIGEKMAGKSPETAAAMRKASEATSDPNLKNRANAVAEKQQ